MIICSDCETVLFEGKVSWKYGLYGKLSPNNEHVKVLEIEFDTDPSTNMTGIVLHYECRQCKKQGVFEEG